ncbi:glycosyltransferase 61 family protein [Fuscibacter oryzae]|uniref:Glycosyltransferase family 61 protein n=1 Tax=Fuscibacter oryzae TaxID=2803939 RepID=A0A8J7SVZ1_9RHOB|nr:glycosyltransferase 61 family protein [Fuscibacter oryzae]MBL4928329.1 glycosyltransferase family 61 protein [Fuscibacter oryzae]
MQDHPISDALMAETYDPGGEDRTGPAAPGRFAPPPEARDAASAAATPAFLLRGGLVDAWFQKRGDTLLVTFDNLASVGEYDPPQPWLMALSERLGLSVLGILASRKDWYRNPDAPALITTLRDAGLFDGFRRILFIGTSMGGYAALAFSSLVPQAAVLAFSPQSTLSRRIAPFDLRYRYGQRRWDWTTPEFLDAAASVTDAEVWLAYDPFVPEDRAHARRISGPNVRHLPLSHMGHRAIREVKSAGLLDDLIGDIALSRFHPRAFAMALKVGRADPAWQRQFLGHAEQLGHYRLALAAAHKLMTDLPDVRFPKRAVARLEGMQNRPPAMPDGMMQIALGDPKPPFSGTIERLSRALILPEREGDTRLASGVLRRDGSFAKLSRAWIRARKATPAPTLQADEHIAFLPGQHLFAGHLRGHFGHFLVESTARLWALDHLGLRPDSIFYLPYRGAHHETERVIRSQKPLFDLLGIDVPIRTYPGALRVERLYLPELGFGWEERYAGSPAYRAFMQGRLGAAAVPEGGERLYISRARLAAQRGGILGEAVIEENLARAGYEIFHPERHPVSVQIARYKAARSIVALDGSALHLAAYVLQPGAQVTMILRRSSANVDDYLLQFRSFAGVTPNVVDVIRNDWVSGDVTRPDYRSVGELNFVRLFDRLKALGHLPYNFRPALPAEADIAALLEAQTERRGEPFRALTKGERHPDEADP